MQSTHLPPRRGPAFGAYSPATADMEAESGPHEALVSLLRTWQTADGRRQLSTSGAGWRTCAPFTDLICDRVGFDLQLLQLGFGRRGAILDRRLCGRHPETMQSSG